MDNKDRKKTKNKSCWSVRTCLEKTLIFLVLILVLALVGLLVWQFLFNTSDAVCLTPGCISVAAEVLEKIDSDVDPCDDFYLFSCGNFQKANSLPDYKSSFTTFDIVNDLVEEQMRTVLEKPIEKHELRPFALAKSVYQACMNTTKIEMESLSVLKRIFRETGGWPVIEGSRWHPSTPFKWQEATYKFHDVGFAVDMFLSFVIAPDPRNTTRNLIQLDQPFLVSFDKLMRNGFTEPIVRAYYDYMVKVAIVFGADERTALKDMKDVIELDIALTRITTPQEDQRNSTKRTNPMTIQELYQQYTYVDWLKYINRIIHPAKERRYHDVVIVNEPKYFENLQDILESKTERVLANYMYWKVVKGTMSYLSDELRNLNLEFTKVASGRSQRQPRWKECTSRAVGLNIASGALYVRNFFNSQSKHTVVDMVNNIREQFSEIVKTVDWMDETTRQQALEKNKDMEVYIAYPDELLDDDKIERHYRDLEVDPKNYLGSMLNVSKFVVKMTSLQLDKPVNKSDWRYHSSSTDVNAYYDESLNSIEFPASILQGVFFDNNRPQYMNYGSIGSIIGHEITHGFDDEGRQFDKDGNLVDWWQPKTKVAFDKKAECIVDQYSSFTVPKANLKVNGINTQGENIADNCGIKGAYLAYKKWSQDNGKEGSLPGVPFTPEQLFWISLGNTWCSIERTEQLKLDIMSDYHAPTYYRVNVPLMNSEYFAEDFKCPLGSNMNPKHKCLVW